MVRRLPANDGSETDGDDEFVRPAAVANEVWLYVRSEGEILPIGMCPLYCQDKGEFREKEGGHELGMAETTDSSELMEGPLVSPIWT